MSAACIVAPASSKYSTTVRWPRAAAIIIGVQDVCCTSAKFVSADCDPQCEHTCKQLANVPQTPHSHQRLHAPDTRRPPDCQSLRLAAAESSPTAFTKYEPTQTKQTSHAMQQTSAVMHSMPTASNHTGSGSLASRPCSSICRLTACRSLLVHTCKTNAQRHSKAL